MSAAAAALWCVLLAATAPEVLPRHQLSAERAGPGHYRFAGSIELPARAEPLAALIAAYDQQCQKGCSFPVAGVTRTEIVPGEGPDHFFTWSFVDDVLDGAYFSEIVLRRAPGRIVLTYATPDAATLARLATKDRPHEPFFHQQGGTWTFAEQTDDQGRFLATRVEVAMEMRSDRWVVNLMPGQILDRTRQHLATLFRYLAALPAEPTQPSSR